MEYEREVQSLKLFGFLEQTKEPSTDEIRPPILQQVRKYIEETKIKIEKKDKAFRIKAIILIIFYLYITGCLTTILRFFGEVTVVGFHDSPKPVFWPWSAIAALFSFKYSLIAILLTLLIVIAILMWWIRSHIGLGSYELEERGGSKFKKQSMDATLGSARKMTPEELVENFQIIPEITFNSNKNPGTILFGRDIDTLEYITEKSIPEGERPNRNTITIGAAGSYKTTNFIIPMIMQLARAGENMIINDSSTEISKATYHLLRKRGYNVKIFNMTDPAASDGWNFVGAVGEDSVLSKIFARMIIDSFAGDAKGGDPFWPEGMYVLFSALILYVNTTSSNTIEQIRYILNNIPKDEMAELFSRFSDDHPAKMEFNTFMTSNVQQNVINGAAQRLSIFNASAISRICSSDGIDIINDLATPDKKTAIFIVTSDTNSTFSFIPSLLLTAAAEQLRDYAVRHTEKLTLPKPVHFIMDEFSNTSYVRDIGRFLSATRKYGLVFHLIVQNLPQFYERYTENEVNEMMGQCEYILVFGIREKETANYFEEHCGVTTVRTSMTQSNSVVTKSTDNFREGEQQRSLYFADEFLTMDKYKYVLLKGGQHPLELRKVFWKDLADYKLTEDFFMSDYTPQCVEYKPTANLKIDKRKQSEKDNTDTKQEIFNESNKSTLNDQNEQMEGSYRKENESKRKPGERKKKNKQTTFENEYPLFQIQYYANRPPVNSDEIMVDLDEHKEKIYRFKNNKNRKGKARQAVLVKYNIDGTTCNIAGNVPDNHYAAVKTKIDLDVLETSCMITKDNCVLIGWKLKYKRGEKWIETKRLKVIGSKMCVNENGELIKSYSFTLPQSDCEISPIFESGKGAEKNENTERTNEHVESTVNSSLKL